jgi:tRNA pseudouridine38-40 synthase
VTVQGTIERAIAAITGESVTLEGSGRTDAGAHAMHQVASFTTGSGLPAQTLHRALNSHLPPDVAVISLSDVPPAFHPRYHASSRLYRYVVWNREVRSPFWKGRAAHIRRPLDVEVMHTAAQCLVGRHDFSAFVPVAKPGSRTRTIMNATCSRDGDLVTIDLEGSGFMRQMVRCIAGTLIRVGLGRMDVADFATVFASGDRLLAWDTAPAYGLYLMDVRYPPDAGLNDETTLGSPPRFAAGVLAPTSEENA